MSRKRVPLNQNECTADFRIGVPFEQNLHLNVGLIIFSGKMTCIIDEVLNYIVYPSGNNEAGLLDLSRIISKYGALAPTIGAGILSTYLPNESIEWPKIGG